MCSKLITSQHKIIPFFKIGNRFFFENQSSETLPVKSEMSKYVSLYFDISFLNRDDIIYLQCIFQDNTIDYFLKDYHDYVKYKQSSDMLKNKIKTLFLCKIKSSDILSFLEQKDIDKYVLEYTKAIFYILDNNNIPDDYEQLKYAYICSEIISTNKIGYENKTVQIKYNPFTRYARYGLKYDSFNILSLKKENRKNIAVPKGYTIFEIDYNAFEIRTLFSLLGILQPQTDLYEKLHENSNDKRSRDEFKGELISSLYSKNEHKTILGKILNAKSFYDKYPIINGHVTNIFGKKMDTDEYHLLSRVLQSSAAYILYTQMYKVIKFMNENKMKSKVVFCIHDSVCFFIHDSEIDRIKEIKDIMENVSIDKLNYNSKFMTKIKYGKNYGEMRLYET